ncbi:MAG: glycoside hydrolase family 97 protein [Bacteroidales bacterium]|nr:glycoside hydrolase family 97 protein [Bacteroidales bacterium]MDZ4203351.1 glycoside hydrolase family 97 protein [Bacteroidales bacterium]
MKRFLILSGFLLVALQISAQTLQSPNGRLTMQFQLSPEGIPTYQLKFDNKVVILNSHLGIILNDQPTFDRDLTIIGLGNFENDESWQPVWGEEKVIRNHYRELAVTLQQVALPKRQMIIRFRLFNDGLGFRYEFPHQPQLLHFIVADENTEFRLAGDHKTFWIPGDYESNEYYYFTTPLSKIDAKIGHEITEIFVRSLYSPDAVQTPLMMKADNGLYINIHEANLYDFPAMQLIVDKPNLRLSAHLVPDAVGNKAYLQTPATTPWRTIIVSDKATDMLASRLILNLNDPTPITDASWIKPQKYVGIWWEMHVGMSSWNYADSFNLRLVGTNWNNLKPNGKHGATTERTMHYIDFAAEHGFDGVLVEGWNIGWEDWFGAWKEEVFDFVTPYPDFDVNYLSSYAARKGVKLIMHHETSSSVTNYERRLDTAFRFMKHYGYDAVKTGYVGWIIPRGEHHDGQWMVRHFHRVAEKAADYQIMVNMHESHRPTGQHRTWPNWLANEAARGNEFNGWSKGNPPDHETILPFTRLMGGPMDYTPGIFQVKLDYYQPDKKEQVHTTLAKQLALYVTMYSPLQMAADLPENYERFMDAFQFIKEVAVDWDESRYIEAEPGQYITIARKAKNKDHWFIGAITSEKSRVANIPLDFLDKGQAYVATVYADSPTAHYLKNPMGYIINQYIVNNMTVLKIFLAESGGCAISLSKANGKMLKTIKKYR